MMLDRGRERERERVDSASDETRITRRLWLVLGGLVFAIIGLGMGILLTNLGRDKGEEIGNKSYRELAEEVINSDPERKNGEQAIEYALAADEAEESVESAIFVLNTASAYENDEIYQEYLETLKQREEAAGIEPNAGGQG